MGAVSGRVSWPDSGPWIVAGTSSGVDWQLATAALAAAASVRVAVLVIGETPPVGELLEGRVATVVRAADGGTDPLTVADVAALVRALRRTHGLVLVTAGDGLLVPQGRGGWTPVDLAVALPAPVVVVTDSGPDATNHTTLALAALTGYGVPASVVTVEAPEESDEHGPLPVAPAGRIPAGAADRPDEFAAAAAGWLDPILRATGGRPKNKPPAVPAPPSRTISGRRVVLALAAVFVTAVVIACGLALLNRTDPRTEQTLRRVTVRVTPARPQFTAGPFPVPVPRATRPATAVCPQYRVGVLPTRPGPATKVRVDAAWKRIENWLARNAPKSRRALRPPAAVALIDQVQRQMSVAFPADLVASLGRHDGVSAMGFDLPPFFGPMPVDRIAADWSVTCGVMANVSAGQDGWWDPGFVPFATAGDGGCLLVDQRPGGHGRVGEFYPEDGTSFERWPASVAELLEKTATSLETGRPYDNRYRPKVTADGALDWDII